MTLYNIACTFALLNETEQAVDCLEKTVQRGYLDREWIENDSDLDSLRNDPRFQELLRRL